MLKNPPASTRRRYLCKRGKRNFRRPGKSVCRPGRFTKKLILFFKIYTYRERIYHPFSFILQKPCIYAALQTWKIFLKKVSKKILFFILFSILYVSTKRDVDIGFNFNLVTSPAKCRRVINGWRLDTIFIRRQVCRGSSGY